MTENTVRTSFSNRSPKLNVIASPVRGEAISSGRAPIEGLLRPPSGVSQRRAVRSLSVAFLFSLLCQVLFAHELDGSRIEIEPEWEGVQKADVRSLQFQLIDRKKKETIEEKHLKETNKHYLHAFIFDSNQEYFARLHPVFDEGVWKIEVNPPKKGKYFIWIQATLKDGNDEVAGVTRLETAGGVPTSQRRASDIQVQFQSSTLRANDETMGVLSFQTSKGKKPELVPYYEAPAHVVVVSRDGKRLIHTHAIDPEGKFKVTESHAHRFSLRKFDLTEADKKFLLMPLEFAVAGNYRAWVEFKVGKDVITAPFDLKVLPEIAYRPQDASWPKVTGNYVAGLKLPWEEFQKLEEKYYKEYARHREREGLIMLSRVIEKETLPALLHVFADPLTVVSYEIFTDPIKRQKAEYELGGDQAAGLRVVWIGKAQGKFVTVIFFYDYDFRERRFHLISEKDAMRVRVEVAQLHEGNGIVGLSYVLTHDKKGKIKAIEPGVYVDSEGKVMDKRFSEMAQPDRCNLCHHVRTPYLNQEELSLAMDNNFADNEGYKDFLAWAESKDKDPKLKLELTQILNRPKSHFLPEGLIEAIKDRIATKLSP